MNLEKKFITKILSNYSLDSINYKSIDVAINFFTNIKKECEEKGFKNLRVEISIYNSYDESTPELYIVGDILETDEEFEKRKRKILLDKENAKKLKERSSKLEYETYLKLKEKFEQSIGGDNER